MYDLVILGGGPAGLTSGIYAQRARLNTVLVEKMGVGGQVSITDVIENYPGFPSIGGPELIQKFEEHARKFGLPIELAEVTSIEDRGKFKVIKTSEGDFETKAVIVATGAHPRKLGIPGEKEFAGKGVSYCATCDGFFYKQKDIVVVGGGDTAIKETLYLAKIVNKVKLVHRRDALRAEKIWQERALAEPKIDWLWNSVVEEIKGDTGVNRVVVKNVKDQTRKELTVEGIFIFVGIIPNTQFVKVKKDSGGFIITDEKMETSIPGIFAAGDCRAQSLKQISTAVGEGALATSAAEQYLESLR